MRAVGIKALKNKLSEYVRLAAGGETVLVTDRDAVVAELGPPRAGRAPAVGDAVLADAVRQGWITPPVAAGEAPPPVPAVPGTVSLDVILAELRADRDAR